MQPTESIPQTNIPNDAENDYEPVKEKPDKSKKKDKEKKRKRRKSSKSDKNKLSTRDRSEYEETIGISTPSKEIVTEPAKSQHTMSAYSALGQDSNLKLVSIS